MYENSGRGLKACLSQYTVERFFKIIFFLRLLSNSFSISLQPSKGEVSFFGNLPFENNFFAYFQKIYKGELTIFWGGI